MRKSYRAHWVNLIRRNLDGYQEVLTWDLFEDWNRLTQPGATAENHLESALELLAGGQRGALVEEALGRATQFAERVIAGKKKLQSGRARSSFPRSRGQTLGALAYARWLQGNRLETELLCQAHRDVVEWCRSDSSGDRDEIFERWLLAAPAMALIAGDSDAACEYLAEFPVRYRARHHRTLSELADYLDADEPISDGFRNRFDGVFNLIRNPRRAETLAAFELAVLRDLYVVPTRRPVRPRHCVAIMAE